MPSTRRALLASVTAGSALLSGCSRLSRDVSRTATGPDEPPESGVDDLPNPDRHVHGADGEWSSFGCNAANTRTVADGEAPVDGVSERWRVEVSPLVRQEPVVAGGRVYLLDDGLYAFDAADGSELWSLEEARTLPLVREDVVYVSDHEGVRALEAETGDELWKRTIDGRGTATAPATYAGRQLICAVGERVVSLDPADGSERWHRDVFGRVLDHAAVLLGYYWIVATEAGTVYAFSDDGIGRRRWQLPATPTCPPSVDDNTIYVNCRDGKTYALPFEEESAGEHDWEADTGWAERGIALVDGLVLVADGRTLHAVDSGSGRHRWRYGIGDWRHTAPAFGRDTAFVGGDRLRALDPTPGGSAAEGPALRFEREFHGRVGPGPVLDDGTLYVVAEVDEEAHALLALE